MMVDWLQKRNRSRWRGTGTTKETEAVKLVHEASYTEAARHVDRHLPVLFLVLGLARL
jgi:hypothetical protein